jgi:hypothetical protein
LRYETLEFLAIGFGQSSRHLLDNYCISDAPATEHSTPRDPRPATNPAGRAGLASAEADPTNYQSPYSAYTLPFSRSTHRLQ